MTEEKATPIARLVWAGPIPAWHVSGDPTGALKEALGWFFGVSSRPRVADAFPEPPAKAEGWSLAPIGVVLLPLDAEDREENDGHLDDPWVVTGADRPKQANARGVFAGADVRRVMRDAEALYEGLASIRAELDRQSATAARLSADAQYPASVGGEVASAVQIARQSLEMMAPKRHLAEWVAAASARLEASHEKYRARADDDEGYGSATFHEIRAALRRLDPSTP